jgi:hypothetical protein
LAMTEGKIETSIFIFQGHDHPGCF